jgi:hypothetical protein
VQKEFYIQSYCHITRNEVLVNGKSVFKSDEIEFTSFIKAAYKNFDIDHSKFFKMDNLSKLAFIASDVLLKNEPEKNIALILSNNASSLDSDRKHQSSIADPENFYPSPAVFVYTLPNICLGEISIKHQLYSENSFFVFENFNADVLSTYANSLLADDKAEKALCGWVNIDEGKYDAFLYVVAKKGTFVHSIPEINLLYKTNE